MHEIFRKKTQRVKRGNNKRKSVKAKEKKESEKSIKRNVKRKKDRIRQMYERKSWNEKLVEREFHGERTQNKNNYMSEIVKCYSKDV